VISKNLEGLR